MARPTPAQMEVLVEFLEQNQDVARGLLRTQLAKHEIKRKWSELATSINALGGVVKDGPGWSKYWAEKKCGLKKLCALQAQSIRRTGGGPQTAPSLSALELRLVAVMGGQTFATGNSQVAVDPFPQTQQTISPTSEVQASCSQIELPLIMDVVEEQPQAPADPISSGQQPSTSTQSARRPSQHRTRLDAEVDKFARIEEKRVDAEAVAACALANIATSIDKLADAVSNIASIDKLADAVSNIAVALLEISAKIQP